MNKNNTSFWKLLKEQEICIPIIQRDYAQGREGKGYLRQKFLKEIFDALKAEDFTGYLTMDFVYGAESDTTMLPLDGQQRLTTLWLIHWYIAFKLDLLSEVEQILKRFSYETRVSSREFCCKLCEMTSPAEMETSAPLLEYIRSQTWFYSRWNQDPTIQAMLRMLCGTDIDNENKAEEINDGIDKFLCNCSQEELSSYWRKLTSIDACPVSFNKMIIGSEQLPMSDELYIKMNARGKALSDFENFKADFVDWIYKEENASKVSDKGENLLKDQAMYASLLDNRWMDIFWNNHASNGTVDEIYFAFINRYFLNEAILNSESAEKVTKSPAWRLYGSESDDARLAYMGFDAYAYVLDRKDDILVRLNKMFSNLADCQIDISKYLPEWMRLKSNGFNFIPIYKKDSQSGERIITNDADRIIYEVSTLTQPQRVLFLAVTKYFENHTFDELKFTRWMRIASNLIENPDISSVDEMIGRMKLINELVEHIEDIYSFLAYHREEISSKASVEQLWEEHEKALQIIKAEKDTNINSEKMMYNHWEEVIVKMENHAFFNGAIRFLFINDNGMVDWSFFNIKSEYALKIFNKEGLEPEYREHAKANRVILSYCTDWEAQIKSSTRHDKKIFNYKPLTWRNNILLKKGETDKPLLYCLPIHKLLTGCDCNSITDKSLINSDPWQITALKRLVETDVIDKALNYKNSDKYYVRETYDNYCLYPSSEGIILTLSNRDTVLTALLGQGKITLYRGETLNTENFPTFVGWEIFFNYSSDGQDYQFQWAHWNTIYMCRDCTRLRDIDEKYDDNGLTIEGDVPLDEIETRLKECIIRYRKIEADM